MISDFSNDLKMHKKFELIVTLSETGQLMRMSYDDLMKNYRSEGIRMRLIYLLSQFNFVCDKLKYEIESNLSVREFV